MKNIITASGTVKQVCESLRILQSIFPKGATLEEVAEVAEAIAVKNLEIIINRQLKRS